MNGHPHGEQLSAYLDGMLDVAQMRAVGAHLAACPQCRAAHDGLRQTKRLLGVMDSPASPAPEFWADAYRRMRVGDASRRPAAPVFSWDTWKEGFQKPQRRWSAGLAAAAVVAFAIAAPLMSGYEITGNVPRHAVAAPSPDSVDVSALVLAHTQSAARQPLADTDRQDMIAMDDSFATDALPSPSDALNAASDASP